MPRIRYRFRPPWYSSKTSSELGRVANLEFTGSNTRLNLDSPNILEPDHGAVRDVRSFPYVGKRPPGRRHWVETGGVRRVSKAAETPVIKLDANSPRRERMFNDAFHSTVKRFGGDWSDRGVTEWSVSRGIKSGKTGMPLARSEMRPMYQFEQAASMHDKGHVNRAFSKYSSNVKPNPSLPYRPATPRSGRVPTPPRPSSGVAPRIAGTAASAILRGTGAMSALPAIVHLARGGSLGSMVPRMPGEGVGPVVTYRDKKTGKTFKLGGSWS